MLHFCYRWGWPREREDHLNYSVWEPREGDLSKACDRVAALQDQADQTCSYVADPDPLLHMGVVALDSSGRKPHLWEESKIWVHDLPSGLMSLVTRRQPFCSVTLGSPPVYPVGQAQLIWVAVTLDLWLVKGKLHGSTYYCLCLQCHLD